MIIAFEQPDLDPIRTDLVHYTSALPRPCQGGKPKWTAYSEKARHRVSRHPALSPPGRPATRPPLARSVGEYHLIHSFALRRTLDEDPCRRRRSRNRRIPRQRPERERLLGRQRP